MPSVATFRVRLAEVQRAKEQASPYTRYTMAASDVDHDTLERAIEPFGAPYGETGFGTSDVFNELLSRDPKYLKVSDLQAHQEALVNMGYADGLVPDGNWSPAWADSQRRSSRDAFNTVKSGGSFLAAPVRTVFRYLTYTMPSEAIKGVYGLAQGIVSDFARAATNPVEVFEEGGALGGATVGAGIGAGIGTFLLPGIGTGVGAAGGAVIGGVAGFFGDLFDDDEEEEGNWEKFWGAWTPIDEIRSGDAKNLFAALSTIMTASAVLKAGSVAVQGVRAAAAMPVVTGGVSAGGMAIPTFASAGQAGLRGAFQMAAKGSVAPGIAGQMTKAALRRPVLGSAGIGGLIDAAPELLTGDFGEAAQQFVRGAAAGAVLGPIARRSKKVQGAVDKAIRGIDSAPLMRVVKSPAGKATQALYTGIVTPTIVARGIGELSMAGLDTEAQNRGFKSFEELKTSKPALAKRLLDESSATGIAEDIKEAPDLGIAGDVLDLSLGMVVFPERLLPWRGADVSRGVSNINKARALQGLGANHELMPWADDIIAHVRKPDGSRYSRKEAIDLARDTLGKDHRDGSFRPDLVAMRATNRYYQKGLDDAANEALASRKQDLSDPFVRDEAFREVRAELHAKVLAEATDPTNIAASPLAKSYIDTAKSNPTSMRNALAGDRLQGSTAEMYGTHQQALEFLQNRNLLEGTEGVVLTPAVKGVYVTQQDVTRAREAYDSASTAYKQASDAVIAAEKRAKKAKTRFVKEQSPEFKAQVSAGEALDNVLLEMKRRQLIDEDRYFALRPSGKLEYKPSKSLVEYLDETAARRPREIEAMTAQLANEGLDRYIAVATGENLVDYASFAHTSEVTGLAEYTRRAGFFDSLASLGAKIDRADIGALRFNSIVAHLDKSAGELFRPGTYDGRQLADAIYDEMKHRYDVDWLKKNRGEKIELKGAIVRREGMSGETSRELFKIDPRDLTPEDIFTALKLDSNRALKDGIDPYEAAHKIKRQLHIGAAFGADIAHPIATARALGVSLRANGLPGFNDFMRTTTIVPTKLALKGERFKKGSYGYLPQTLRRAHMAVQFSLSPTFDASRYIEAMAFGKMRGGDVPIKIATNMKKFYRNLEDGTISPVSLQRIEGQALVDEVTEFGDRLLYGRAVNRNFDEVQLQLLHRGVLGYKPREVEYGIAYWLASKKAAKGPLSANDLEEIRETVMQITQYGTKSTAFGNSAHFVFFPFLFSRKQLSAMVDFSLGAPTRNLLIHEGFRRWYQVNEDGETLSAKFAAFMERHIPVAKELERINNLAYGVSPGRFFLDGIMDKRTEGKVGQGLASFFLPGGVHQGVADTVGTGAEALKNLFVPVVMVDDAERGTSSNTILGMMERLIPAYRDLDRWFFDSERSGSQFGLVGAQATALAGRGAPYAQMSDYLDLKKVMGATLETASTALGYSSWESLRASNPELAQVINDIDLELGERFPQGKELANTFTNKAEIKEQVIYAINNKDNRTLAESAIATVGDVENQVKFAAAKANLTQEQLLRAVAPIIRNFALKYVEDRQFRLLWDELFANYYGPLVVSEVA